MFNFWSVHVYNQNMNIYKPSYTSAGVIMYLPSLAVSKQQMYDC